MIKLDLVPSCIKPVLHASQYDEGRQWPCEVMNDGVPFVFQNGDTVDYTIRKGDSLLVTGAVAVTPGTSTITLVSTEQMCAVYGSNLGELTITSNGTKVGSVNFILEIERAPDEGGLQSESEIKNLNRQITDYLAEVLPDEIAEEVPAIVERVVSENYYNKQESDSFLADEYDATQTYAVGDYCIYEGGLYVCNTAISTAEAWNASHWTSTDVGTALATKADATATAEALGQLAEAVNGKADVSAIPTKTSQLQNNSGFVTSNEVDTALATKADIVTNKYLTKTPVQTYTSYRMSYRTTGTAANLCYIAADANCNCKAYKVTAGETYKIQAYGYDVDSFYIGAIGEDLVSGGQTTPTLQPILCGGSTYPTDYTNHIVEFTAQYTGYLYLNERPSTGVSAYAKGNEQIDVRNENGLIIKDGKYTHFVYLGEGQFLIREFTRRGPNNLFQLVHVGIGYFANNIYVETKSFMTATTDIIGPFSIDKVGWGGGQWTGGNHSVTVNGVDCPTAEQLSLSVTVNNEAVSDNGTYYGDIKIIAKNKLYFAQTITGNTFEGATPAILETRLYNLTDTMNVEVYIELLDDVRFAKYYGMQYVNSNVVNVVVPDDETVIAVSGLASNYSMTHKQPDIILQYANGEELHMILHRSGLGSYVHNNGNEYYGLISTYNKTYHTLISSETISTGSKLYWSGEYRMII